MNVNQNTIFWGRYINMACSCYSHGALVSGGAWLSPPGLPSTIFIARFSML